MAKSAKLQAASSSSYDVGENLPLLSSPSPLSSAVSSNAMQDGSFRLFLYNIMTHRHSSPAARIYSYITFSLVIVSVAFYVVRSLPQYWPDPPFWLWLPESICFALLFIFQVIRFSVSREHCETLRDPHTTLTLLAVVPFVLDLILSGALHGEAHRVLSFVRFLEVFRVLMLTLYSTDISILHHTLRNSVDGLLLLGLILMMFLSVFGAMMFYAEQTEEYFDASSHCWRYTSDNSTSAFQSVLHCYWWCIVSMSSTGYGDVVPRTPVGKMVAGLTIILGLLVFTFPVAVVGSHFMSEWTRHKKGHKRSHSQASASISDSELLAQMANIERALEKLRESMDEHMRQRANL